MFMQSRAYNVAAADEREEKGGPKAAINQLDLEIIDRLSSSDMAAARLSAALDVFQTRPDHAAAC